MDLVKLIQQIDELFYEMFATLVFFPMTLWHLIRNPQRMMDYADSELGDVLNEQYRDTISPPKFMMICLGIGYLSEKAMGLGQLEAGAPKWLHNVEMLLTARLALFSVIPLVMAMRLVVALREPLDRDTLRPPFYSQCYLGGVVILMASLIGVIRESVIVSNSIFTAITLALTSWYLIQQVAWFKANLNISYLKSFIFTINSFLISLMIIAIFFIFIVIIG